MSRLSSPPSDAGPAAHSTPAGAWALLGCLTLAWGFNWPFLPVVLAEMSVWTLRAGTLGLAGLLLLGFVRLRGLSLAVPRRNWPWLALASVGNLSFWNVASGYAVATIPSGHAAVIGFSMPLWAALIGFFFLGERLTRRNVVALGFGAAALGLLLSHELRMAAGAPLGFLLMTAAAIAWAAVTFLQRRIDWGAPLLVVTTWQVVLGAAPLIAGALLLGDWRLFVPTPQAIGILVFMAIVSQTLGMIVWFRLAELLPANKAGLASVLVPVVATVSAAFIADERLGWTELGALAAIVASLWLALVARDAPAPPGSARGR